MLKIMAFEIFDEFIHFIIWPHIAVYVFYFIVKYMSIFLEIGFILYNDDDEDGENHLSLFCLLTCCCFGCCCCNCCNRAKDLIKKVIKCDLKLDRWLIKLLLGRQEGVIERHHDGYRVDEDSEGKPFSPIYIRHKSLSSFEVTILSTLVFTFALLVGITAFDIYFLDVSYACSDDTSFSCFVLPVNVSANKTELGITNKRIDSCSPWENNNISDQVYVVCYKWIYNFKGVTVAVGALLTLFQLTVKAATSIFISLNDCLWKAEICGITLTNQNLKLIRKAVIVLVFVIEMVIFITVVTLTLSHLTGGENNKIVKYLSEHGNQVLLMFGIISTCLLLPIEDYAQDSAQQQHVN